MSVKWTRAHRGKGARSGVVALVVAALLGVFIVVRPQPTPTANYIVHASSASVLRNAATGVGGKVEVTYPTVGEAVVSLTASQAARLRQVHGVQLAADTDVQLSDASNPGSANYDSSYPTVTGASKAEAQGDTGAGVTVAVLDTGIDAALPDLAGRVVGGVDFTGGNSPLTDQYGHGTFVAGLIASNGASSNGAYVGEAPGADLVSVKVAGANGETAVSTIVHGVAWVIANRAKYGIGVLNLSLGMVPQSSSALDPLDIAVEQAWRAGIVVVVSAGNAGPSNGTITSPGNDPLVVTVGALDDNGGTDTAAFSVPSFSSAGPTRDDGWLKPDVVAPGSSVVSLADPGSTIYENYPSARVGAANFVGSGTSFSAAIVSGEAALLRSADPSLTPDKVKSRLLFTADRGPLGNPLVDGHGIADVANALQATSTPQLSQGSASIAELAAPLTDLLRPIINLGLTWVGSTWDPSNWSGTPPPGTAWNLGSALPVVLLSGASWNGASWNGASWNGASWNGASWNGASWNGASWNGASWNGASWNGLLARGTGPEDRAQG